MISTGKLALAQLSSHIDIQADVSLALAIQRREMLMDGNNQCKTKTLAETAKILGVSRGTVYEAARSGQIPTVRVGRRWLVPTVALEKMLEVAR
jgi:excisionase family DNA binding protein